MMASRPFLEYSRIMDCIGRVESIEGRRALVLVDRTNCGKCRACGMLANSKQEKVEYDVHNRLGAKPGDEVTLRLASGKLFHAYLIVFGLPVVAMIVAYLLGAFALAPLLGIATEGTGVALALLAGFLGFLGCLKLANRMGLNPYMESISPGAREEE
jgi:positive regulator of sigma E activity